MQEVNDTNFQAEVLNSQLPVMVDFWASWCGPCRMLSPIVENIASKYSGKLKVVKLNVDEAGETAAQYGITAIPTLIFFKGGQKVEQKTGFMQEDALSKVVEAHI